MTDRPILFSAPMVRALLDGRKTQTRRLVSFPGADQVHEFVSVMRDRMGRRVYEMKDARGAHMTRPAGAGLVDHHYTTRFAVGDRLWVREAHALVGSVDPGWLFYRASGYEAECKRYGFDAPFPPESRVRWRPSLHMPRWASRLTLVVTDVRVQRLKAITREDAIAEGLIKASDAGPIARELGTDWGVEGLSQHGSPVSAFAALWDQINGSGAWNANPWVCAVSFTVHRANIDQIGEAA